MKSSIPIINGGYGSLKSVGGGLKDKNNILLDVRENMDEDDSDSDLVSLDGPQKENKKFKLGT